MESVLESPDLAPACCEETLGVGAGEGFNSTLYHQREPQVTTNQNRNVDFGLVSRGQLGLGPPGEL